MILFHIGLAFVVFVVFAVAGAKTGFHVFTIYLMRNMESAFANKEWSISEDNSPVKGSATIDRRVLECLFAAVRTVWSRCEEEPKNFLRLEFEDPNPKHKVGTWYLIITKKSDYNPFVHIEEQRQEIMKLKQELAEK